MDSIGNLLIWLGTAFNEADVLEQLAFLIPVVLALTAFVRRHWRMTKRLQTLTRQNNDTVQLLRQQTARTNEVEKQLAQTENRTPDGFLIRLATEEAEHNYFKSAKLSEQFYQQSMPTFTTATATLARDALAYIYIDRGQALRHARAYASVAKTLDPADQGHRRLCDSIAAALEEHRRKLKREAEEDILDWALRTPPSGDTLFELGRDEMRTGHYRLAQELLSRAVVEIEKRDGWTSAQAVWAQVWLASPLTKSGKHNGPTTTWIGSSRTPNAPWVSSILQH